MLSNVKSSIWFALGLFALTLGSIGIVLPVLPTTPFVILAAFAFGKSSRRLQFLLEESATFGPIIADWRTNGAIAPRYKTLALMMMVAAIVASVVVSVPNYALVAQLICILAAAVFILSRPNRADKPKQQA